MTRARVVDYQFVHFIPEVLAPGTLYVSTDFATRLTSAVAAASTRLSPR